MGLRLLTLQIFCCAIISIIVFRHTQCVTLTLSNNDNLENTDVHLRCNNEDRMLPPVRWTQKTPIQAAIMSFQNNICSANSGFIQDSSRYSYDCTDGKTFIVTIKAISREINGQIWLCDFGNSNTASNEITIYVNVPVMAVTISPYNSQLTEKENTSISLQCATSACRPEPKFMWYKQKNMMTDRDAILLQQTANTGVLASNIQSYSNSYRLTLTRELNGWYIFCAADNQNNSFVLSNKILFNVTSCTNIDETKLDPADGPQSINNLANKGEFKVLQNDFVRLECSVTGGNPLPRLEWDKYNESPQQLNGNTVTKTTSWQATGRDPVDLTCQSFHIHRNDYVYIKTSILYPPDKPDISIETSSGIYANVNKTVSVIEGQTFKLNCSAKSNPPVSLFKWNDLKIDLGNVYVASVERHTQSISCSVSNEMRFSDARSSMTGYNISRLTIDVLYPPTVTKMPDRYVNEGDDIIYQCNFEPGNPSDTNVIWSWNGTTLNDDTLTIINVSMHHAGVYRCDVRNMMVSSEGTEEFGNASGKFNLFVQSYKTDNTSPTSSNVSVVAASAAGTVVGVVFLVALIIMFMVYRRRKLLSYQKKDVSVQYYNFNQSKGSDRQYNSLSPEDCKTEIKNDGQISTEGGNLHVYEGLQTKGFDQQYETISSSACRVKIEQHKVYENLQ